MEMSHPEMKTNIVDSLNDCERRNLFICELIKQKKGAEVIFSSLFLLSQERSAIILNLSSKQITGRVVAERLCTALIGKHDAFPLALPDEGPFEFRKCVNDLFCNKTGVVTTLHAKHTAMPHTAFMLVVIETPGYLAVADDIGLTEDER